MQADAAAKLLDALADNTGLFLFSSLLVFKQDDVEPNVLVRSLEPGKLS